MRERSASTFKLAVRDFRKAPGSAWTKPNQPRSAGSVLVSRRPRLAELAVAWHRFYSPGRRKARIEQAPCRRSFARAHFVRGFWERWPSRLLRRRASEAPASELWARHSTIARLDGVVRRVWERWSSRLSRITNTLDFVISRFLDIFGTPLGSFKAAFGSADSRSLSSCSGGHFSDWPLRRRSAWEPPPAVHTHRSGAHQQFGTEICIADRVASRACLARHPRFSY